MKSRYVLLGPLFALVALLSLSACGSSAGTKQEADSSETAETASSTRSWNEGGKITIPTPKPNSGKGVKIAFTGFGQDNPYSQWIFKAIDKEAKKYGATATFIGPPSFEPEAQYELLSTIAQSKDYTAVIMLPIDGAQIIPAVEKLVGAGIKVASVSQLIGPDPEAPEPQIAGITTEVFAPVVINAETMGEGVIKACEGVDNCEVDVLWGARSLSFDHAKVAPFKETIAGHSNIHVVCETDANYTQDEGRTESADCLSAHPNLSVVASQADESARGAESSIEAAGKTIGLGKEDVKVIGSYASRYGVQKVREGKWLQTWYSRPESMGFASTDLILEALEGKKVPDFIPQESLDDVGSVLTKETLKEFPQIEGQWEG